MGTSTTLWIWPHFHGTRTVPSSHPQSAPYLQLPFFVHHRWTTSESPDLTTQFSNVKGEHGYVRPKDMDFMGDNLYIIHVHVYMYIYISILCMFYVSIYIHTHCTSMYLYVCMYICIYIYCSNIVFNKRHVSMIPSSFVKASRSCFFNLARCASAETSASSCHVISKPKELPSHHPKLH